MEAGNVEGERQQGTTGRQELSSPNRAGKACEPAKRWTLIFGAVVLVTTGNTIRAAATLQFADGRSIESGSGGTSVFAADLDGDGDLDVLSALKFNAFYWYENTDGLGDFSGGVDSFSSVHVGPQAVSAADLNGDGYIDVLAASSNDSSDSMMWFSNADGSADFSATGGVTIATDTKEVAWVTAADLDGDGDMDVIAASINDSRIVWYENTDGQGTFGVGQNISTTADGVNTLFVADLDGDGDMDVVSASYRDNRIVWYENRDGMGAFSLGVDIASHAYGASYVYAADLDGDNDLDVISASPGDSRIVWYENTDGSGTFSTGVDVDTVNKVSSVVAADLDNDGDMDLVCCSGIVDDKRVVWYENTDGKGDFSPSDDVPETDDPYAVCEVIAADLDGDGDLDLLAVFWHGDAVIWYENLLLAGGNNSTSPPGLTPAPSQFEEGVTLSPTAIGASLLSPTRSDDATGSAAVVAATASTADTYPLPGKHILKAPVTINGPPAAETAAPATVILPTYSEQQDDSGDQQWSNAASEIVVTVAGTVVGGVVLAIILYFLNKHLFSTNRTPHGRQHDLPRNQVDDDIGGITSVS